MNVLRTRRFLKNYRKLSHRDREAVDAALAIFAQKPFHPQLRNHMLKGNKEGVRSISAGYDLRILYYEQEHHTVVLLITVGNHEEVY